MKKKSRNDVNRMFWSFRFAV